MSPVDIKQLFENKGLKPVEVILTTSLLALEFRTRGEAERAIQYFSDAHWDWISIENVPKTNGHVFLKAEILGGSDGQKSNS